MRAVREAVLAAVLAAAAVLVERGAAFSSRGCMWSGGVPAGLTAIHRVVLVGDRLSWDSADYKLLAAVEALPSVQEALFVQADEVDEDLLALQFRSFDPDTVLVSVRTRAFELLPWKCLQIARTQCTRGNSIAVIVFHLQAHAIPAADRAFANVRHLTRHADGYEVDSFESRAGGIASEVLPMHVDDVGPLDADDLLAGGLELEWFGPSVPERWCSESKDTPCAGPDAPHDIIVLVSAVDCDMWSGGEGETGDGEAGGGGCREARFIQKRYQGRQVVVMQASNASTALALRAHLMRAGGGGRFEVGVEVEDVTKTRELLISSKVLVIAEAAGALGVLHAVESIAMGGPGVVIHEALAAGAGSDDIVNGTHALVYKTGDLEELGGLLDQMLSDGVDGREQRCGLRQRAYEDACMRHTVEHKVAKVIGSAHARVKGLHRMFADEECLQIYHLEMRCDSTLV